MDGTASLSLLFFAWPLGVGFHLFLGRDNNVQVAVLPRTTGCYPATSLFNQKEVEIRYLPYADVVSFH